MHDDRFRVSAQTVCGPITVSRGVVAAQIDAKDSPGAAGYGHFASQPMFKLE